MNTDVRKFDGPLAGDLPSGIYSGGTGRSGGPRTDGFAAWMRERTKLDWLFALVVLAGSGFIYARLAGWMDGYEKAILLGTAPAVVLLAWYWRPLQLLILALAASTTLTVTLYAGQIANAEQVFLLRSLFASQSAILWMAALFGMGTISYWIGLLGRSPTASFVGTAVTWGASFAGLHGLGARWHESYLFGPDVGHVPVSNLYEVFVLFAVITALFYLYYEARYATRQLGGFVMLVVAASVGFLLWYTFDRQAHEIQPLVPALQSWWMKLHVPANFIGYGTFALASMVGFAYLIKTHSQTTSLLKVAPLWAMGVLLAAEPFVFRKSGMPDYWAGYFAVVALLVAGVIALRGRIGPALPSFEVLDDIMYKSIAIGFAFFTIATILGALWAADAWGAYWQWDPKETWALIVWLNYAAWLHMRLIKGLRGAVAAYWAIVGLLITGFAFLGVNMFLSGLHSYGEL